jgi:hypothetical protein
VKAESSGETSPSKAESSGEADIALEGSPSSTLPPESAELSTVEDAALPAAEVTQPAGTTKKEKERHRKAQQSLRKAEEVKETLEKAMASMAERVARCVRLL